MNNLKNISILVLLIISSVTYAQQDKIEYLSNFDKAPVRWGFYIGGNKLDYKISYKAPDAFPNAYVESQAQMGFNLGMIGDLRITDNINIRLEPGLMANSKTLYFRHIDNKVDSVRKASGTFLHIPLLVQFSTNRLRNIRPYVVGGMAYDYNFASNFANPNDNSGGEFRMQKHNFMYEIGIGMDFYFYYFKFSPSIRGLFALNNEIKPDNHANSQWTEPIDYFGTRGFFIQLNFQ